MPNYEYECTRDGYRFELWQPVGEAAPPCPECQSPTKKVFHVPRVIFKGSGFYVTDLRGEKEAKSGNKAGESSSDNNSSEAKTPETPAKSEDKAATPAPSTSSTPAAPAASDKS